MFSNLTLPSHWLSRMRTNIHELVIVGGNLRYISSEAFMTQFAGSIQCLILEEIFIKSWTPHTLVGLSSLKQLILKSVNIHDVQGSVLEAVDDTLETLKITTSGSWNPKNFTGSTNFVRLTTVDFSFNLFRRIIDRKSFTKLKLCEILFLNSCGIESIGAGAFDCLKNLKVLHLNNNFLVIVPSGLFKSIASNIDLRVNLQDNKWLCDCHLSDLRLLSDNDMILVDPICYFPEHVHGKSLRAFYNNCANYPPNEDYLNNFKYFYFNGSCGTKEYNPSLFSVISPIDDFSCPNSRFRLEDLENLKYSIASTKSTTHNNLMEPTFTVRTVGVSAIEISSTQLNHDFGILWYQTECPYEIYCLNILPNFLRIYDVDVNSLHTFCPLRLSTKLIQVGECIMYGSRYTKYEDAPWNTFYILTAVAFLLIGALCTYLIIKLWSFLLKQSKKKMFLKRNKMEDLVSPTKTPSKTKLDEQIIPELNNTKVFVVHGENKHCFGSNLKRTESITSTKSNAPSYIFAPQHTEDSFAHWCLRHHFDNNTVITAMPSYVTDECSLYSSLDQFSIK